MTADELARVTAERDAAVSALARVEALADEIELDTRRYENPPPGAIFADRIRVALDDCASLTQRLAQSDAGAEVADGAIRTTCGCQVVEREPRFGDLPDRPTYALGKPCARHEADQ